MSDAPSSAAWKITEFTRRTSGASETPSSNSRSSASSSSWRCAEGLRRAHEAAHLDLDVVARRNRELDVQPRREADLVERLDVRRIDHGDAQRLAFDRVGNGHDPLQDVKRHDLRRLGVDADGLQVDERQLVACRERARDAVGARNPFVDERLRQRAGLPRPPAREGELVLRDQAGRREKVGEELRRLVDRGRAGRAQPTVLGGRCLAPTERRRAEAEIVGHIPRSRYRQKRRGT
jgi:hypothetical protein